MVELRLRRLLLPELQGETWSISGGGERYNRWWGENHIGDGLVQKFGNSNTGALPRYRTYLTPSSLHALACLCRREGGRRSGVAGPGLRVYSRCLPPPVLGDPLSNPARPAPKPQIPAPDAPPLAEARTNRTAVCNNPPARPPDHPPAVGEHWDVTEQMDTYYNPIPHFGYNLALEHSPQASTQSGAVMGRWSQATQTCLCVQVRPRVAEHVTRVTAIVGYVPVW